MKYLGYKDKYWYFQLKGKEYKVGYRTARYQVQFFINEYYSDYMGFELTNNLLQFIVFATFHGYLWENYKLTYIERITKEDVRFNLNIINDIDFLGIISREEGWLKQ